MALHAGPQGEEPFGLIVDPAREHVVLSGFAAYARRARSALRLQKRELARGGNLQQRIPVIRGIDLRRRARVRCRDRAERERFSRARDDRSRINQAVTAHPHFVVRLGKIRNEKSSAIVGDHDFPELRRQIARLRNHPDGGFRSTGSTHHPADIFLRHGDLLARAAARRWFFLSTGQLNNPRHQREGSNRQYASCDCASFDHTHPQCAHPYQNPEFVARSHNARVIVSVWSCAICDGSRANKTSCRRQGTLRSGHPPWLRILGDPPRWVLLAGCAGWYGCTSSSGRYGPPPNPNGTPAGSYSITVTAAGNGGISHSASAVLKVN